jgi:hypothetical protein
MMMAYIGRGLTGRLYTLLVLLAFKVACGSRQEQKNDRRRWFPTKFWLKSLS